MGWGFEIPWIGVQHTMDKWFDIPCVGDPNTMRMGPNTTKKTTKGRLTKCNQFAWISQEASSVTCEIDN
jgi:hypothetical protein